MGILRKFFIWLDNAAFGLVDDAYSIIFDFAAVNVDMKEFQTIKQNLYIIVGIFSLFRIALFLINSLIDPDKLNEKGKGLSSILSRTLVMLVMLVICPFLFNELFTLQNTVMKNNIIPKLIIGKEIYTAGEDNTVKVNQDNIGKEAGTQMKSVMLQALVPINRSAFKNTGGNDIFYQPINGSTCDDSCADAVNAYSEKQAVGKLDIPTLQKYINVQAAVQTDEESGEYERVYVYDYMIVITTAAGAFITYMLFSFALDIAIRMFELIILQVASPIFIVTFIDPKSASSGPFKRWLQAIGKSYATLFLRIGVVCLMVLLVSWVNTSDTFSQLMGSTSSFLAKAALVIGLLIFVKNFPKWISGLFGVETSGFGGLNIGKKLAGAALVGGMLEKGLGKAKDGLKKVPGGLTSKGIAAARNLHANHKLNEARKGAIEDEKERNAAARAARKEQMIRDRENGMSEAAARRKANRWARMDAAKENARNVAGRLYATGVALNAKGAFKDGANAKGIGGVIKAGNQNANKYRLEKGVPGETLGEKIKGRFAGAQNTLDSLAYGTKLEQLNRADDAAAAQETARSYVNGRVPSNPINNYTKFQEAVTGRGGAIAGTLEDQIQMIGMADKLGIKSSDIVLDGNGKITGYYDANGSFHAVSDADLKSYRSFFDAETTTYGMASIVDHSKKLESNLSTEYSSKNSDIKDSQQLFSNAQSAISNALKIGIGNAFSGFSFDGSSVKLDGVSIDNIGDKIADLTNSGNTQRASDLSKIQKLLSLSYDNDGNINYGNQNYSASEFSNYINNLPDDDPEKKLLLQNNQNITVSSQSVRSITQAQQRLEQIIAPVESSRYVIDYTTATLKKDGAGNPIVMNGTIDQCVSINTGKASKFKEAALEDAKAKDEGKSE